MLYRIWAAFSSMPPFLRRLPAFSYRESARSKSSRYVKMLARLHSTMAIAMVECNRANIFTYLDDFDLALSLYEKAGNLLRNGGMELKAAQIRYNIPYLHFRKGNYNEALKLLQDLKP